MCVCVALRVYRQTTRKQQQQVIEDYAVRPDGAQAAHAATTGMHHHHSSSKQQSAAMDRGAYDAVLHVATPFRTWREHTMDIVDLSWNANDFLLSASIDRTVRGCCVLEEKIAEKRNR